MRALDYINVITLLDEADEFQKNKAKYVLANILIARFFKEILDQKVLII